jgi:hypothetical protein
MKASRLFAFAVLVAAQPVFESARAQASYSTTRQVAPFTDQELDNLVAPVALYPDPILAQVLVAATFPDQVEFAARYVRSNGTRGIDDQPWDISVKAVAHYLPVLNMLAERVDWTTTLGQAYATQSGDVMDAVQRLREMARAQGNLESTEQQNVYVERERIRIVPAHPTIIYVPTYDPWAVYYRRVVVVGGYNGFWSFGIGFPIGGWLSYDCDWWGRRVYYDGWRGGGWRSYSRPYIHVTNVYVHPRYEVVHVNRTVINRTVNYYNLRPYNAVHRTVTINRPGNYGGRGDDRRVGDNRPGDVDNRVITGRRDDDGRPGNNGGGNGDAGTGNGRGNDRGRTDPRGYVQYPDRVEQREVERRQPVQGSVTYGERPQVVAPSRQPTVQPRQPQVRTERPRIITPPSQVSVPLSRQQPTVRNENYPTQRTEARPTPRQSNGNSGGLGSQSSRPAVSGGASMGSRAPTITRQSSAPPSSVRSAPRGQVSAPSGKAKGKNN